MISGQYVRFCIKVGCTEAMFDRHLSNNKIAGLWLQVDLHFEQRKRRQEVSSKTARGEKKESLRQSIEAGFSFSLVLGKSYFFLAGKFEMQKHNAQQNTTEYVGNHEAYSNLRRRKFPFSLCEIRHYCPQCVFFYMDLKQLILETMKTHSNC